MALFGNKVLQKVMESLVDKVDPEVTPSDNRDDLIEPMEQLHPA